MIPTTQQISNREKFRNIVKTRKDIPWVTEYTNMQGNFCFVGLGMETMRREEEGQYIWHDGRIIPANMGMGAVCTDGVTEVAKWLGVEEEVLDYMISKNDSKDYDGWEGLWSIFEGATKERENGYNT